MHLASLRCPSVPTAGATDWSQVLRLYDQVRPSLLRPLGRDAEADTAYTAAISLTQNAAERAHLVRARARLSAAWAP